VQVERAEKLQAELERERDKTRQMADTLNMRTDESNCFERAYQLHLGGGLRPVCQPLYSLLSCPFIKIHSKRIVFLKIVRWQGKKGTCEP
jgi:hypothetical protein